MFLRKGIDGAGGGSKSIHPSDSVHTIESNFSSPRAEERVPAGVSEDVYHPSTERTPHILNPNSVNGAQHALLNSGIHLDNARATLQILKMPGADRRAILHDVARSLSLAERELSHAYHGRISREGNGKSAIYDFEEIQNSIADIRRCLMREMHDLCPGDRIPILTLLNPPFERIV